MIIYYIIVLIAITGLIMRLLDLPGGLLFLSFGITSIFVFYTAKLLYDLQKKLLVRQNYIIQLLIVLMSVILFSKYLYHTFGDIPALIIIPIFIIYALFFLMKGQTNDKKTVVTIILYFIYTIPILGFNFMNSPRKFIPTEWYKRYDVSKGQTISLPYAFKKNSAKELFRQAHELKGKNEYDEAVKLYEKALIVEPDNPRILFDLSECYAHINKLEKAISLLDRAIIIDDSFAPFYINRGLLYYKLKENTKAIQDYNMAIELDSSQAAAYGNLSLVYYYEEMYDKACESLRRAEDLNLNLADYKELAKIDKKYCE